MIRRKLNTESFIKEAILIHGDKYDYKNVVYTTFKNKVTITCKIHGEFKQSPSGHIGLQKQGYPTCGIVKRVHKIS